MVIGRAERVKLLSRARRDRQRLELRQAILDAAREIFDATGYDGFSLRQVAERIGYSPTTIYLHFTSKDDLLAALLDQCFDEFVAALRVAATANPDPVQRLRELGRAYVTFGLEHAIDYRLMFMQRSDLLLRSPEQGCEPRIASFNVLRAAVEDAQARGLMRPGDSLADANTIWAVVHGVTALAISMPSMWTHADAYRATESAFTMLMHGIALSEPHLTAAPSAQKE